MDEDIKEVKEIISDEEMQKFLEDNDPEVIKEVIHDMWYREGRIDALLEISNKQLDDCIEKVNKLKGEMNE